MEQPRPRYKEESFMIVVKRSWFYTCADVIFSLFFWLYSLVVVLFFLSAAFYSNNNLTRILNASLNTVNQDIRILVITGFVVFLVLFALLYVNHIYNKKRFGPLERRCYPSPVNNAELKNLGLLDSEIIEKLQSEDYTVFDTNPITPLGGGKL
ncbi:hypothetical protein [Planococcus halocryophilus]|uniref:hypothetical protein n=1 Tax=Planococcus halocryophilus TaxID=1215089 RepID=UPI001F0FDA73|nr:hypothetical protein [Planococcus halocryophilus]MCH4825537.1 hypothetical protein [Planococcus halocryophilus]